MSNHLISEAYKRQIGNMARKAVMVLMADKASDDGTGIWASKQRMADEIGATKQTVITTIKSLIADGLVRETGQRRLPNGFTVEYAINVKALLALPLVKSHQDDRSENLTGQGISPVKSSDPTGQIPLPHQSRNLTQTPHEPNITPQVANATSARAKPANPKSPKPDPFPKPDWADPQVWEDFLANRKRKSTANTATAYKRFLDDIARLSDDEWPPGRLLEHAASRGWAGIYDPRSNRNGNSNIRTGREKGPDRRNSLTRACDEGLEFLG